ncbi:C-C motif chemokine 25 precursor [Camelus ferus]|nr:C-C motif chemokine 25 precursor [Camelus ferus]
MAAEAADWGQAYEGRRKAVAEEPRSCRAHAVCLAPACPAAITTLQGSFEDCCLAYHSLARPSLLRRAHSYQRQDVSGSCNLPAVIFFFPQKDRMVCGRPGARWVQIGMKILDARSKTHFKHHHGTWRNFQEGVTAQHLTAPRTPRRASGWTVSPDFSRIS